MCIPTSDCVFIRRIKDADHTAKSEGAHTHYSFLHFPHKSLFHSLVSSTAICTVTLLLNHIPDPVTFDSYPWSPSPPKWCEGEERERERKRQLPFGNPDATLSNDKGSKGPFWDKVETIQIVIFPECMWYLWVHFHQFMAAKHVQHKKGFENEYCIWGLEKKKLQNEENSGKKGYHIHSVYWRLKLKKGEGSSWS